MTAEPNEHVDPKATDEWLDGLAGRGGGSPAAVEGAALRSALNLAEADMPAHGAPGWDAVVSASEGGGISLTGTVSDGAANTPRWKRLAGAGLAALVAAVGVAIWGIRGQPDAGDSGLRGSATPGGARWLTDEPEQAAIALADRLRNIGANVISTAEPHGVRLDITCAAAPAERLNEQLSSIEVAVDSGCKLSLHVLRAR